MSVPIYVVDAFTAEPFSGNPAGVCLLETAADPDWMQHVATEMQHAETAFVRPLDDGFELRWFTPSVEVDLCGHATLAAAHTLWQTGRLAEDQPAKFYTRSGLLVARKQGRIRMDFPAERASATGLLRSIRGLNPVWTGKNRMDWLVQVASESEVRQFVPEISDISALGMRGVIVTAVGSVDNDFVSRFFAPEAGVYEDPVTGSAHCCLGPFWAERLGKSQLRGFQASSRGGIVEVEVLGDRVDLIGEAVTVLQGTLRC